MKNIGMLSVIIDFAEDTELKDIEDIYNQVRRDIDDLEIEFKLFLERSRRSEVLLRGIRVILLGPPNAGKSCILNKLSSAELAIVSDIPGTTRDVINVPLNINGYKVVVGDTAGIRNVKKVNDIEAEGIRRTKSSANASDLVVVVLPINNLELDEELILQILDLQKSKPILVVLNKFDLVQNIPEGLIANLSKKLNINPSDFVIVSCVTGYGMDDLNKSLVSSLKEVFHTEDADPLVVTSRVRDILLHDVLCGIEEFKSYGNSNDVVFAAETLQKSVEGIGKITGETVGVEEILGVVFSSFCIGK